MTIQTLENEKQEILKEVNTLTTLKKKLYSNMDIEAPMSIEEKELNKKIAAMFSRVNQIVKDKKQLL